MKLTDTVIQTFLSSKATVAVLPHYGKEIDLFLSDLQYYTEEFCVYL